ncbi:MAG: UbiX family flavin prenyltransferase [Xanthomonadales bacterium]
MKLPLVVGITGASGVIYGVELLKALQNTDVETHLILSESAGRNLAIETNYSIKEVRSLADVVYSNKDVGAAVASGSFLTRGMVVVPCTIKSLSGIAYSYADNLITRAADVTLKEKRTLVMMVRETPLHKGHLEMMARCADLGATILPPMPSFYHGPQSIQDIINQSIGKVLDQMGIEHNLFRRWGSKPEEATKATSAAR